MKHKATLWNTSSFSLPPSKYEKEKKRYPWLEEESVGEAEVMNGKKMDVKYSECSNSWEYRTVPERAGGSWRKLYLTALKHLASSNVCYVCMRFNSGYKFFTKLLLSISPLIMIARHSLLKIIASEEDSSPRCLFVVTRIQIINFCIVFFFFIHSFSIQPASSSISRTCSLYDINVSNVQCDRKTMHGIFNGEIFTVWAFLARWIEENKKLCAFSMEETDCPFLQMFSWLP